MNIAELDSFNLSDTVKFHDRLNPRLWDRNEHLHPEVRDKLLEIAADFQTFLGVPDLDVKDITVSGSNAAYNYTNHSDIDLHLVVDLPEADQNEVFRELFDAKKYQYNDQHNIKIAGYNVELYVQDPNKPHHSQGIYSLLKNAWVRVPTRRKPEINDISVASKVEDLGARIEDVIESGDYDRIRNLFDKLKRMRQAGLDQQGEFGSDNLAYKVLRNMGLIQQLVDARNQAKDQALSLTERKKKKRRVKYGFGGWFYPGYSFDTGSDSSADGGGGDGGGESIAENSAEKTQHLVMKFIDQAAQKLGIESMPRIELHLDPAWSETEHSFGRYTPETHTLEVNLAGRHIMDILRTTAHELAHCRQHQESPLPDHAGETGSPWENEAHAVAGVIMRDFADANPGLFESSGYIPTEAERNDPRFEMALTQDVRPGEIGRQANKMALKTDSQGRPGLLMKTANLVQEGRMPQPSKGQGRYRDLNEPLGPEFKPTMPAGTVRVDVSDMYDWYKLGQHISNMKGLGRHDFGAGPPSTIFSFGDEDLEHQYIDALKKTGLDTTDIDPAAHDPKSGQKTDPTYNVDETVDDSFGRRQAQKGRTPYYKNPDIEVPVHKLPSGKTEQFAQFEVEPARGTVAHIVGITRGGDRVRISTTTADLAAALVDAYNRHGFSDKYIQRVPLSAIEPQPEPPRPPGLKRIKEAWLVTDVPNEDWLAGKQASAKESGKNRYGVPAMGSTTAYVRNPSYIELPVSLLARIPGARGEQQNVRYNDLAAITKIMKDTGQLPLHNGKPYMPFIAVAYDGSAWTMEGNHRIMAAKDLGWKTLPVELKYFDGGERVESGPLYPGKIGLNPPPPGSVVRMNEGAVSPDYMAGHCHVMALAMLKLHPDWKLRANIGWEDDAEHDNDYRIDHVYVVDPHTNQAWDCRGSFANETMLIGPVDYETQIVDYSLKDMKQDIARGELKPFSVEDIEQAKKFAQRSVLKEAVSYTDPNQLVDLYLRTRNKKNFAQVTVQRVFKDLPYKQIDRAVELLTKKYNVPPSEISWAPSKKSVSESNNNPQVDLTPNYPNYEQLVGEFQGINKNQRAVFRIITAALRPGAGATEKIEKAFANGTLVSMELSRIKNRQVIEASLGVAEAFDRPYPLKWEKSEYGDYDALARLDDGTYLSISFEHVTPYEVAVSFWRNNSQAVTGEGDAQRVFATVLKAVQKFLKIEQPANISFSAVKEDDPSGSRSKLYSKLVQRYSANWGYQARSFEHDDKVEFELTKIRQNVDEVFNTQPSKSATWARPIGQWDEIDEFNFVASNGVAYQVDFLAPVAGPDELDPYTFFEPEEEISDQAYDSAKFVSFEQKSDGENTVGKQGIEGTGVAAEVFGIVTNVMLQYIKKAKPSMLYFQAAEPNRQRLYARMAARLAQTIQWKVKQDGPAHFAIYNPRVIKVVPSDQGVAENFADGKVKGKSRPGRVKRAGASCSGSVTDLRARAKKYGGERGKMYHWCANMKSGRSKTNESADTIYYHGGNTAITQPRVPAHGMYFSPHREWAEEYGPVITQARVINPRIYLVDYDEDIDDDIVEALFDRDYAKVGEYIKMLAQQGYTALQTVTDSEMLVVFPGSRIEIIGVEK